jgi:hypothetical protein
MPFSFKLSHRLALTHVLLGVAVLSACSDRNISSPDGLVARISPDSVTVAPAQTVQFLAYGDTPRTGPASPVPVTWSASRGSISSQGVYTADSVEGLTDIYATDMTGRQAAARVHTLRALRQVILVPSSASLAPGASLQFRTYGLSVNGDSLGVAVAYNATGGSINASGVYTAGAIPGTYRLIATNGTLADTSAITITTAPPPSSGVAVVEVVPGSATVAVGATFQLRATARDASGNEVMGRTMTWASANTGVATVSSSGLVRGVAGGSAQITATADGKSGTAAITVPATPAAVATVQLSPASATVNVGATVQLSVRLLDASGNVLTNRSVSWVSSAAGVATVDGGGLVRGVATGTATITASSEGKSATASINVPPATGGSGASECAAVRPEWIWCDDFEQNRLASYFEYDNAGGNFTRTNGTGFGGSAGMRVHFVQGALGAGSLHLAIGRTPSSYFRPADAGTANYREIYWRMYVKHQAGWVGGSGDKLSRAFVFANSNWAEAAIGHVWGGASPGPEQNILMVDPASGTDAAGNLQTTSYNDFAHLRWLGMAKGTTPIFDDAHVGQWYCLEAHMRLNTAGSSNGALEVWVNGALEASSTGLNFLGAYSQYGINAVYFENYWNAGASATQDRFFDNIVVSTAKIGCLP